MSESEPLDVNVGRRRVRWKEEKQAVASEQKLARERTAEDQAQLAQLRTERAEQAQASPPATLSSYNTIRKKWNGVVIAEAVAGRCSARARSSCDQYSSRPQTR
jgi:predicted  nucleic acid-binding Zn-ribbon protein